MIQVVFMRLSLPTMRFSFVHKLLKFHGFAFAHLRSIQFLDLVLINVDLRLVVNSKLLLSLLFLDLVEDDIGKRVALLMKRVILFSLLFFLFSSFSGIFNTTNVRK